MLKKKFTKTSATVQNLMKSGKALKKYLACKECNVVDVEVAADIAAVTCGYCVQRQCAPPEQPRKAVPEGEKFPRGWALKTKYVHTDGRVFEKGKEVESTPKKPLKEEDPKKKVKQVASKVKPKKRRK